MPGIAREYRRELRKARTECAEGITLCKARGLFTRYENMWKLLGAGRTSSRHGSPGELEMLRQRASNLKIISELLSPRRPCDPLWAERLRDAAEEPDLASQTAKQQALFAQAYGSDEIHRAIYEEQTADDAASLESSNRLISKLLQGDEIRKFDEFLRVHLVPFLRIKIR